MVADWGGDASGLDASELLAASGYEVALAVGSAAFGETLHAYQRNLYAARLYRAGIEVWHHLELAAWDGGRASFTNIFAPELEAVMEADALVLALGRVPVRDLEVQGRWRQETGSRRARSRRRSSRGLRPSRRPRPVSRRDGCRAERPTRSRIPPRGEVGDVRPGAGRQNDGVGIRRLLHVLAEAHVDAFEQTFVVP